MRRGVLLLASALLWGALPSSASAQEVAPPRLAGGDRVDTAIEISQEFWLEGADSVVLARADLFPDALAGGPLADLTDSPILLTASVALDTRVRDEIQRLGVDTAYLLGGPAALSEDVADYVADLLPAGEAGVVRLGGANRYHTASIVTDFVDPQQNAAVVASGRTFPDALMAVNLLPPAILLSGWTQFDFVREGWSYTMIGGPAVLSEWLEDRIGAVRLAGENRYATAATVLQAAIRVRGPGPLFIATGGFAPDALAAGGALAREDGYLLIVDPLLGLHSGQAEILTANADHFTDLYVLGGPQALPDPAVNTVVTALGGFITCADFEFQEDAQAFLEANPSNLLRLDEDGDGIACEDLPSRLQENQPPEIADVEDHEVTEGEAVSIQVDAADPDGDELSYRLNPEVEDTLTIDGDGLITGTAPDVDEDTAVSVTVTVTDEHGDSAEAQFRLLVLDAGPEGLTITVAHGEWYPSPAQHAAWVQGNDVQITGFASAMAPR